MQAYSASKILSMAFVGWMLSGTQAWADVSGTVYRDLPVNGTTLNTYGVQDANESGVAAITVTVTDSNGAVVGAPVITDASGNWTVAGTTGNVRIEFSNLPTYLESSPMNNGSNTTVQFIADGGTANLGLHNPAEFFSSATLDLVTSVHSGSVNYGSEFVVVKFPETSGSSSSSDFTSYQSPSPNVLAEEQQIGAIWGLAYDRSHQRLLAGAFVKRFARLAGNPTTIYSVPVNGGIPTEWFTLDNARADPHGGSPNWSEDFTVTPFVGKEGLGDIDIAEDDRTVYAIDMGTREFIHIPVNTDGSAGVPVKLALPVSLTNCPDTNDARPMGLGVKDGNVYVGMVCSAESTVSGLPISNTADRVGDPTKLIGYIYVWDGNNTFSEIINFPLDYERGCLNNGGMGQCTGFGNAAWQPWTPDYPLNSSGGKYAHGYPQPMISDIDFNNGDMVIGLVDRFGHMDASYASEPTGFNSGQLTIAGDTLHACYTGNNTWEMEQFISGSANCSTVGLGYDANRSTTLNEYYYQDDMGDAAPGNHADVGDGGIAVIPGRNHVISSAMDPARGAPGSDPVTGADPWESHGLHWYDGSDGSFQKGYVLVDQGQPGDQPNWGKGSGIGDVEVLFEPAPLEIGNRVWEDTNGNGIQDASEAGIDGVIVTLNCGGADFTQTTANGGQYLFTDANVTGGIPRDTDCTISVPTTHNTQTLTTQTATANEALGSNPDTTTGSFALRTGLAGQNNHTYDIGYRNTPTCTINPPTVTAQCRDNNTPTDPSDDRFSYTINTTGTGVGATYDISGGDTQTGLTYNTDHADLGDFAIAGGDITVTLTDVSGSCSLGNVAVTAPATCSNQTVPTCTTIINTATITNINETDTDNSNDSDSASIQANCDTPESDLRLVKRADKTQVVAGETLIFTLELSNEGAGDATDIEVSDQLPAGVTYISDTPSQGTYNPVSGIWAVGNLANGASATLTIEVSVD